MANQHMIQYVNFYTDGSAAKKIQTVAPAEQPALPKKTKQKRRVIRLDPFAILGIAVAVCMLIMMTVGLFSLSAARNEAQIMQRYVDRLNQEKVALEEEFEKRCDMQQIETTALALGMVPADQIQQTTIYVAPIEETEQTSVWMYTGVLLSDILS